jgi:UDP-N-acetylglucosamine--N-acetylmuramyl-(pentapeptide) pyrophosphoryl-undecaprenol N-acetylglucosamine transferase
MGIRILIAGGGTSGHVNPAIAIADKIHVECPDSIIEFCGTSRGIEKDIVPRAGYMMHEIRASGMPSRLSWKIFRAFLDFRAGRKKCISLIRSFRPDVVIGTGGYVCSPLVSAAYHEKIAVLLHEQNAFPGRSNRLMSKKADVVCTSFPDMEPFFPRARTIVMTGNPVRSEFNTVLRDDARKELAIDKDTILILAMGGSLGARTINQSAVALARMDFEQNVRIVLSAGKQQFESTTKDAEDVHDRIDVKEYLYNLHIYMAAADLMICRAGAITCAEVAATGTPSVMIPYPYAAGDHQSYNAKAFLNKGACVVVEDKEATADHLFSIIRPILSDQNVRRTMSQKAKELSKPDAVGDIVRQVIALATRKNNT